MNTIITLFLSSVLYMGHYLMQEGRCFFKFLIQRHHSIFPFK